jgi:glycosyltransferase involved in cell wall biosynthesis
VTPPARAVLRRILRTRPARRLAAELNAAQRALEDPVTQYAAIAALERAGAVPLAPPPPAEGALSLGFVVPPFRRGSGGHTTIAHLARALERRGHRCSVWLDDPLGRSGGAAAFQAFFGPLRDVRNGLAGWRGADVAIATGWQTVATVLRLPGCSARAHLVQDDEPEFYPASAERLWAQQAFVLPALTAGTWLAERMRARGLTATPFELGIDHAVYRSLELPRRPRVLFYARSATPRRAVPLGLLALAELHRRRPAVEIALYGDVPAPAAPFPFTALGILDGPAVARAYAEAAAGLVLSLTNHSLVAQEMAACGLPAVELRTPSTEAAFDDAPIELAEPTAGAIADALERVLDDPGRSAEGARWAATRTWDAAAAAVEAGLRRARED